MKIFRCSRNSYLGWNDDSDDGDDGRDDLIMLMSMIMMVIAINYVAAGVQEIQRKLRSSLAFTILFK